MVDKTGIRKGTASPLLDARRADMAHEQVSQTCESSDKKLAACVAAAKPCVDALMKVATLDAKGWGADEAPLATAMSCVRRDAGVKTP
ncbi:MAG: hypothetical protein V4735_06460 [Pseudomonadota bacterium]